jgi:hypothetical protein
MANNKIDSEISKAYTYVRGKYENTRSSIQCMCVRACARACVRACVSECTRACVTLCVCVFTRVCV